jgi:hypothetical protein
MEILHFDCEKLPVDLDIIKKEIDNIKWTISELQRLTFKEFIELSIDEKYAIRSNMKVLKKDLVLIGKQYVLLQKD